MLEKFKKTFLKPKETSEIKAPSSKKDIILLKITKEIPLSKLEQQRELEIYQRRIRARELGLKGELTSKEYLESLPESDRDRVLHFLKSVETLDSLLDGIRVGVSAIGSTVAPKELRYHSPEDIDLRIMNSTSPDSDERKTAISLIRASVRSYFVNNGIQFEEGKCTVETRMVIGENGSEKQMAPFVNWYNNNPSFTTKNHNGTPLHISISGPEAWDLDTHVQKEREGNSFFTLLLGID